MRAGCRQRRGRRKPDAASAAGDERALAVEAEGGGLGEVDRHAYRSRSFSLPLQAEERRDAWRAG